ncbi:MAG TPA: hypothetical protein VGU68_19790 [Ktedonobacteraceae bacterium]|nr:hypothetical protein [Ktedonobacteraceae bacterium]
MPRGRKGPPQDSVDSILLAISRRDDIESDTLAHYFDRLDEEWTDGAREKVLHLLRSADPSAHAAAVLILSDLATEFDLEELEEVVADPTVSDVAKLSLSPILKELGSEMADDGIVEYLNDPMTAMQQMQIRLLEMVGQSEMGAESVLEDVVSMPLERRLAFVAWLGSSNDPRASNLLVPLLENQTSKVVTAVIDALEQLGPIAAQQTIPALNYLIANNSNRSLKQHARAALGRLTMQSMPGVEDVAMAEARSQQLPPHEARVSFIDGSGAQLIMLSWQRPDGLLKGVNVLFQDEWGIKDCYGIDELDVQRWNGLVGELDEQGFGSFSVSFAYGRSLIAEARAISKRTRHKLPIAYSIWRPLIETIKQSDDLNATTILEPRALDDEALTLMKRGDELYQMTEFLSWIFEPTDRIEPYMTRYWTAYNIFESSPAGKRPRPRAGRKAKQKEEDQRLMLDALITEALTELVDDRWRALYEVRLRRQGALFRFAGRDADTALIGAVAAALHPDSQIPLTEQAFPRAMMRISIEQGPLRMMV